MKNPGEHRPYGRWRFVKYLGLDSDEERERVCEMIKIRTDYATFSGNVFPVYGTTDRIAVSKEAFCDWLNLIFNGDRLFFQGLQRTNSHMVNTASSSNNSESDSVHDVPKNNMIVPNISANSSGRNIEVRPASTTLKVSPDEQWCLELQHECFRRANDLNVNSQSQLGKLNAAQKRILKEFVSLANASDLNSLKKVFKMGLSFLDIVEKSNCLGRGSMLGFSVRLAIGRVFSLLKRGTNIDDSTQVILGNKTFQRCYTVYMKVQMASNLRFAWGGHFDKLAKHGGVFKKAALRHDLDFGGESALETVELDDGTKLECVPFNLLFLGALF